MIKTKKLTRSGKKYVNATKIILDGITFQSKLEAYCYEQLKSHSISAEYEKVSFEILPAFEYDDKKIRKMTYTPDFVGSWFIIECKGRANEAFPLRWKVFQWYLLNNNIKYKLFMPRNNKDIDKMIKKIKEN